MGIFQNKWCEREARAENFPYFDLKTEHSKSRFIIMKNMGIFLNKLCEREARAENFWYSDLKAGYFKHILK